MNAERPIISMKGIRKQFGSFVALHQIDFDIAAGEFFSLLGASGCGKTTLLRILAGIEQPTAGDLLIDGQQMAGIPANRRPTNMVFQSYAIFPHLNVQENIGYGLRNLRLSRAETAARVEEAIHLVKLDGLAERNAHHLSGGQRQRVALARALVMRPKVLLLDEPLSALDKKLREEMQLELRALQRTVGITFVFVTHDQEEALTLSDRIAIMAAGRVLQIDTPRRLYAQPANREVAEFIGTMNFFAGSMAGTEGAAAIVDCGALGRLSGAMAQGGLTAGAPALLALRPEMLRLTAEGAGTDGATGAGALPGIVTEAAYLGDRIIYQVALTGSDYRMTAFEGNQPGQAGHAIGATVRVSWDPEAALVLKA